MRRQDLDGDVAAKLAVAGPVDLAHATDPERRRHGVGTQRAADHLSAGGSRGDCRRLEKPLGSRLELQQRCDFLAKRPIAWTFPVQKGGPFRRRHGQSPLIQVRNQLRRGSRHMTLGLFSPIVIQRRKSPRNAVIAHGAKVRPFYSQARGSAGPQVRKSASPQVRRSARPRVRGRKSAEPRIRRSAHPRTETRERPRTREPRTREPRTREPE